MVPSDEDELFSVFVDQETHSEQTEDHPSASVEGKPRDRPWGPVQQRPAGVGPLPPDHLLLPGPHPHTPTQGETRRSAAFLHKDFK